MVTTYIKKTDKMILFSNITQGRLTNEEQLFFMDEYTTLLDIGTDGRVMKYLLMSNPNDFSDNDIAEFLNNVFGYERTGNLFILYGD